MIAKGSIKQALAWHVMTLLMVMLVAQPVMAGAPDYVRYDLHVPPQPNDFPDAGFGTGLALQRGVLVAGLPLGLAVGASAANGYVHLYRRDATTWNLEHVVVGDADARRFGSAVAIDDAWLAVGAPGNAVETGAVYLFRRVGGVWSLHQRIDGPALPGSPGFGKTLALKGEWLFVGSEESNFVMTPTWGHVYAYRLGATDWHYHEELQLDGNTHSGDRWGTSLAFNGTTLAAGAPAFGLPASGGAVHLFRFVDVPPTPGWIRQTSIVPSGSSWLFGSDVALCGDRLTVAYPGYQTSTNPQSGSAWTYALSVGAPDAGQAIIPSANDPTEGFAKAVSCVGGRIVATHPSLRSIYVFNGAGATWTQRAKLTLEASDSSDFVGKVVTWGGDVIAANPRFHPGPPGMRRGVLHVYASDLVFFDPFD